MIRRQGLHNLRSNEGERSPRRLLVLDSESSWAQTETGELHQLRLWVAASVRRSKDPAVEPQVVESWSREAADLVPLIERETASGQVLWLFAHNLSVDLTLTDLPLQLLRAGWTLGKHNLASDAPWAHFKRGKRSLRLADSFSWLPTSVEKLGELLGVEKPQLPEQEDSVDIWLQRCRADVAITTLALCRLMDEWDRLQLGWWSLTGPASGWNAMLHMTPKAGRRLRESEAQARALDRLGYAVAPVVIDPDPEARSFEREAIYSGRRDVWRTGRLPETDFVELDFRSAHMTVCATHRLPDRRLREFDSMELDDWRVCGPLQAIIAEVVVRAREPRYPLRVKGAVLHPVGEFKTVLCGPEIADARERGELVSIGHGYTYRLGRFMQPWATWGLEVLADDGSVYDPMLRVAMKGWSRSVPGRWGMLVARPESEGESPHQGWWSEPVAVGREMKRGERYHLAGRWTVSVRDQEGEDSFPAVLAMIQSWVRVYLNRALDELGQGATVQVNTDSLLCHAEAVELLAARGLDSGPGEDPGGDLLGLGLEALNGRLAPQELRIKGLGRGGTVLSPQHIEHAGRRRFSGVPASAEEVAPGVFRFLTWPKLRGQMERGDPRGYVRELREVRLTCVPVNRWAYLDGCVEPVGAHRDPQSGAVALEPPGCLECRHGAPLRPVQHAALRGALSGC